MCGICGVVLAEEQAAPILLDALTSLQHRGQDAAGISTIDDRGRTRLHKGNGLVADVFRAERDVHRLVGRFGVGHVRYPTAGSSSDDESQPFYTPHPYGVSLAHNGNLTNSEELKAMCSSDELRRQINTESDSECLLGIFAHELAKHKPETPEVTDASVEGAKARASRNAVEAVFAAVTKSMEACKGAYGVVCAVAGVGVVGFRDPFGIRPLAYASRADAAMIASETVAIEIAGFPIATIRDVAPGEAVLLKHDINAEPNPGEWVVRRQCAPVTVLSPCIFEFVYFARPDSIIDGASVYQARVNMGRYLAHNIRALHPDAVIDVVVPVPSTSRISALECAQALGVQYKEALVRNRYTQRTFIMPGQKKRQKSVRMKLNPVSSVIKDQHVLLVDDSIVRGTTSAHIVEILRAAGAKSVYFASAAPAILYPNVYGIDMPTKQELIAHNRTVPEVAQIIGADWVVYQEVEDLVKAVTDCNPGLTRFDKSCFDGVYCAGELSAEYFADLCSSRSEEGKERSAKKPSPVNTNVESAVNGGERSPRMMPPPRSMTASPLGGGALYHAERQGRSNGSAFATSVTSTPSRVPNMNAASPEPTKNQRSDSPSGKLPQHTISSRDLQLDDAAASAAPGADGRSA